MTCALALAAVLSQFAPATTGPAQDAQPSPPPASIALVTTFADGRTIYDLVSVRPGGYWTPLFPRVDPWRPPAGTLPVAALKLDWQLTGDRVRVAVSVLRGSPHQQEDLVAVVFVTPGRHSVVNELRGYGVQPVDLSLIDAAPMVPFLPSVTSVSPDLQVIAVDLLTAPYPGYRITVRNLSSKAVANFRVQSYRGDEKAISFVPRGPDGRPAVAPGDSYSFDLKVTSGRDRGDTAGRWSPEPLDVVEIESVLWDDGTIAGSTVMAGMQRSIPDAAGRRMLLARAVEVLRALAGRNDSPEDLLSAVRSGFEALPAADPTLLPAAEQGMRDTRSAVLADLARFDRDTSAAHDVDGVRRWMQYTIDRYQRWMARP